MELKINLTKEERNIEVRINNIMYILESVYRIHMEKEGDKIHYRVKEEGKNKGQYGYYISNYPGCLLTLINEIKKLRGTDFINILDLGSGAGLLMKIISSWDRGIVTKGYEIEDSLVRYANYHGMCNTIKKDILTLTTTDLEKQDILYFWEPLSERKLAKQFVDNLAKVAHKACGIFIMLAVIGLIMTYCFRYIEDVTKGYTFNKIICYFVFVMCVGVEIFLPTRNEALLIIAGGKTIEFIKKDTSTQKVPGQVTKLVSDALNLLQEQIKTETK